MSILRCLDTPAAARHLLPRGRRVARWHLRLVLAFLVKVAMLVQQLGGLRKRQPATVRREEPAVSYALVARGLPPNRQHMFVLWAADDASSMKVGEFMVDRRGGCRVRFNLPANHSWTRFWVSQPGNAASVVAST